MTPFIRTLPIALAAAGLLTAAHGARAASDELDIEQVHVLGSLTLREACPSLDLRELADDLVPAWDDAVKPSSVEVDFKLQSRHIYEVRPATDLPRLYHQIRHAVYGLPCDGGDDQVHPVRFVVRFVAADDTRVATVTAIALDDAPGR